MAAAIERGCVHPLSIGIIEAANVRGLVIPEAESTTMVLSGGIEGRVQGSVVHVGNLALVRRLGIAISPRDLDRVMRVEEQGQSPILVAIDSSLAAILSVSDPIRDDAKQVVSGLQDSGWKVGILSGDNPKVVSSVATRVGGRPFHRTRRPHARRQVGDPSQVAVEREHLHDDR